MLRGIRETTRDIDILASASLLRTLSLKDGAEVHEPPESAKSHGATNTSVWINHEGLAMPLSATDELGDGYYPLAYETHRDETNLVDGILCLGLPHIDAAKKALGRPQDIVDLELIATHLRNQT